MKQTVQITAWLAYIQSLSLPQNKQLTFHGALTRFSMKFKRRARLPLFCVAGKKLVEKMSEWREQQRCGDDGVVEWQAT